MDNEDLRSEGDINISENRRVWQNSQLDEETLYWLEQDSRYFLHQSLSTPCLNVLKSCDGSSIEDLNGRKYYDFHGNNVHQVGFSHPEVIKAITEQMNMLPFCTRRYTNIPAIKLARKLGELATADLNKVLLVPGGTSAIGMAIKLARVATGRFKTISMWDSFHGASLDAISIGGEAVFRKNIGPLLSGTEHVPPPDPSNCPFKCKDRCSLQCADYIEYVLEKEGDVAAVISETVRSIPYIPPKEYWKKVRKACDKHGTLLILDEIPHALGRTGKFFTFQHYDILPDMVVIGKGLGGGIFPLAALIAREKLDVMQKGALGHYTHEKNPVACAAALATIAVIKKESLCEKALEKGSYFLEKLKGLMKKYSLISDVRGIGLLVGIELMRNDKRAYDQAEQIMYLALEKGLNFKVTMGNVITLTPSLTITYKELDDVVKILEECFCEIDSPALSK